MARRVRRARAATSVDEPKNYIPPPVSPGTFGARLNSASTMYFLGMRFERNKIKRVRIELKKFFVRNGWFDILP